MIPLHIDPLRRFTQVSPDRIIESLGILPYWIDPNDERTFKEQLEERYAIPLMGLKGVTIDSTGVYHYPEDPPSYPVAMYAGPKETVYFYRYAFVGIVNNETKTSFLTRMD